MNSNHYENPLYGDYKCKKGHFLNWTGSSILREIIDCKNCGKLKEKNSIRWNCDKCQQFFCQFCLWAAW